MRHYYGSSNLFLGVLFKIFSNDFLVLQVLVGSAIVHAPLRQTRSEKQVLINVVCTVGILLQLKIHHELVITDLRTDLRAQKTWGQID